MSFSDFFQNGSDEEDNTDSVYIFDASSLIKMVNYPSEYSQFTPFWGLLNHLVNIKRMLLPLEVKNEMKVSEPLIREWVDNLTIQNVIESEDMITKLFEVIADHPKISFKNQNITKEEKQYHADPHVVALARSYKET